MARQPTCSCSSTSEPAVPTRIIFPCAGQANTGQLTNLAAIQLTEEGYGGIACVAQLAIGAEGLVANTKKADEVIILDGCPMQCAKKIAAAQGLNPGQHIIVTELGIAKAGSRDYTDADIETVVSAVWESYGRKVDPENDGKKPAPGGCGCGDSCGGSC
jgi:uncharacterized metal-binding protein